MSNCCPSPRLIGVGWSLFLRLVPGTHESLANSDGDDSEVQTQEGKSKHSNSNAHFDTGRCTHIIRRFTVLNNSERYCAPQRLPKKKQQFRS
ncbi:hypothetical protein BGX38DRAFT_1182958 [Terfezia claveryi]|nr:hypothetical protein BGX38DRAFT_1182958 [Terfezia claveryi]